MLGTVPRHSIRSHLLSSTFAFPTDQPVERRRHQILTFCLGGVALTQNGLSQNGSWYARNYTIGVHRALARTLPSSRFSTLTPMIVAWDALFYPCLGLGASVALRGSFFFVLVLHMDTVRGWCSKGLAPVAHF